MGTVTEYIASVDEPARSVLQSVIDRATRLVPDAEEGTSYGLAALRYRGRPLVSVVQSKQGYTVYPFSSDVVAVVMSTLDGFDSTKGGIRFTHAKPLPDAAVDALVSARRREIDAALDGE